MALLQLPIELRLQIRSTYLEILYPIDIYHVDQVCSTLDCFCGTRYLGLNARILPLLLASRWTYAEVCSVLTKANSTRKYTFAFCSPICAANIIPKMSRLHLQMTKGIDVHTHGVWGVPIEAVRGVQLRILKLLENMEADQQESRPCEHAREISSRWTTCFDQRKGKLSSTWVLRLCRTPPRLAI